MYGVITQFVVALAAATPASDPPPTPDPPPAPAPVDPPAAAKTPGPSPASWTDQLRGSLTLDTLVGQGTFVADRRKDDPYYASTLTLSPAFALTEHIQLGLSASVYYEWTYFVTPCHEPSGPRPSGAPPRDCSDVNDPNGRRADLPDVRLSASHNRLLTFAGATLSGRTAIALPTSRASRGTNNLLTWSAGIDITRPIYGKLSASLGARFAKFFPAATTSTLDADDINPDAPIGRCPSFRRTDCVLLTGFLPTWRAGVDFGVAVEPFFADPLSFSMSFSYDYGRRFGTGGDDRSTPIDDANGDPVVDGVNESDTTTGTIEVGYAIDDHFSASAGVASSQPVFTQDGQSLRFPFFDLVSPANNFTSFYLTLAYSL